MGKQERRTYLEAIRTRYRRAGKAGKSAILNGFCASSNRLSRNAWQSSPPRDSGNNHETRQCIARNHSALREIEEKIKKKGCSVYPERNCRQPQ